MFFLKTVSAIVDAGIQEALAPMPGTPKKLYASSEKGIPAEPQPFLQLD
jgi:hypothetical protein